MRTMKTWTSFSSCYVTGERDSMARDKGHTRLLGIVLLVIACTAAATGGRTAEEDCQQVCADVCLTTPLQVCTDKMVTQQVCHPSEITTFKTECAVTCQGTNAGTAPGMNAQPPRRLLGHPANSLYGTEPTVGMRKLLDPDDEDEEPDMPNDPDSGKKHHHRRRLLDPDDEDEEPDMPNDPDSGKKHHHRRRLLDPDDEDEEPDMPNDPDSGKKRRLLADAECQRVCKKVPIKSVTTKCEHKVKKVTTCKTVNEADCLKECKNICQPKATMPSTASA